MAISKTIQHLRFFQIPRGVRFSKANSTNTKVSLLCDEPTAMNDFTLRCEIGNPLPAKDEVRADGRIFVNSCESFCWVWIFFLIERINVLLNRSWLWCIFNLTKKIKIFSGMALSLPWEQTVLILRRVLIMNK